MKVTVGKIKKRKIILLNFVILLFVVWWLGVFFIMYKHFYERIMFLGVLLIILLIIYSLVLPGIVFANTMWEVDQKYLRYIYFDKNLDKAKYLYSFLFKNKYPRYQINLKLSQIDFVQISYYRYSFYPSKYLVNGSGNKIVFKFNMLDGSQYIIENLVSSDKETFSKGIELMKKNGVRFVDSYHLLDIICSNKNLDQYIVAIEKEKKHDTIQDIYFVEIEKKNDLNILNHLKKLDSTLIYIIGPKDFDLVSICLQMQTHLYFINNELEKQFIHYHDFIQKQIQKNFQYYLYQRNGITSKIRLSQIYYIESLRHQIIIHSINGEMIERKTLSQFIKEIQSLDFIQIHKSYIINKRFIQEIKNQEVILKEQTHLPIGRSYKESLKEQN